MLLSLVLSLLLIQLPATLRYHFRSLGGCKRGGGEERLEMVKACSVFGGDAAF